ncbi:hypothetical protein L2D01_12935 [Hyphomonadaceae bacterium ML37]|nr:hypothetical protein L2D01_12935 [Hyphomonadaceae bacterium ML37]
MSFIARMFTRFLALILALSVFGVSLWLAFYMRPEGAGGWVLLIGLPFAGALAGLIIYGSLMRSTGVSAPHPERTGAGMMVGLGYRARQSDEDELDL